tara:strand:+ start:1589 stop:3553 length:1965 start_codon:yes stop_codon:yes gene_type:complete
MDEKISDIKEALKVLGNYLAFKVGDDLIKDLENSFRGLINANLPYLDSLVFGEGYEKWKIVNPIEASGKLFNELSQSHSMDICRIIIFNRFLHEKLQEHYKHGIDSIKIINARLGYLAGYPNLDEELQKLSLVDRTLRSIYPLIDMGENHFDENKLKEHGNYIQVYVELYVVYITLKNVFEVIEKKEEEKEKVNSQRPYLTLVSGDINGKKQGDRIYLGEHNSIGRAPDNTMITNDPQVSRRHVTIDKEGMNFVLKHLGTNPTSVNDEVIEDHYLQNEDRIEMGDIVLSFTNPVQKDNKNLGLRVNPLERGKYAIFSDVHGNFEAIQEVFKDMESEGVLLKFNLGDIFDYGPSSIDCAQLLLLEHKEIITLMGNHDIVHLDGEGLNDKWGVSPAYAFYYTQAQLEEYAYDADWGVLLRMETVSNSDFSIFIGKHKNKFDEEIPPEEAIRMIRLAYERDKNDIENFSQNQDLIPSILDKVSKLPLNLFFKAGDVNFGMFHGCPQNTNKLDSSDCYESYAHKDKQLFSKDIFQQFDIIFVGHSHIPMIHRFISETGETKNFEVDKKGMKVALEKGMKYVINVGSVGQPRDKNPNSCYAVFDTTVDPPTVTLKRVSYDIEKTRDKFINCPPLRTMLYDKLTELKINLDQYKRLKEGR